jgi:hypothetical protein
MRYIYSPDAPDPVSIQAGDAPSVRLVSGK